MPADLLGEMRNAAKLTNLSIADAMRQSMRLGLPKLVERLSKNQLKPFTEDENRLAFEVGRVTVEAKRRCHFVLPPHSTLASVRAFAEYFR